MFLSLLDLMRRQTGLAPEFLTGLPAAAPGSTPWLEEDLDLVLRVPLPGIDPTSVQVQVSESLLSLAGQRTHEERMEGPNFYRSSAAFGAFARTLPLPARVIPRESRAAWLDGEVLEIRLRKA